MYRPTNNIDQAWRSRVGSIVGALIASIVAPIALLLIFLLIMASKMEPSSLDRYHDAAYAASMGQYYENFAIIGLVAIIAILGLFIWYCVALSGFASIQKTPEDKENARKILHGVLITSLGSIGVAILIGILSTSMTNLQQIQRMLKFTPFIILGVQCAGMSMTIGAYRRLSESISFNDKCREGFEDLRISVVLSLISSVISCLSNFFPGELGLIAGIAMIVLGIISIVKTFTGWSRVKNNSPYLEDEAAI